MTKNAIEQNLEKIDKAIENKNQPRLKALMQNLTQNIKNESVAGISEEVRQKIKSLVSSLELEAIVHFPTIVADLENIKNELGEALEVKTEVSATDIQNETAPHMAVKVEWEKDLRQKMEADPAFNVMYFNNEKGSLEGVMRKLNGLGCRIKSTVDLVMMIKNSVLEAFGKTIQDEDVLSLSSVFPEIKNEEEYLRFRKRLKDEFRKTMPKPVAAPATPAEITKVSPEESVTKTGEPSVKLVREALPVITQNPTIAPEIPKISEKEKTDLGTKKQEIKVERETKNLEKLALENAPKEFREWTMLFNTLHHRDLPEDAEKAAKAKKNRETYLGVSDEKAFYKLRGELERGALRKFIGARDRIKAMEAMGGVENLDEKSIKKNLERVIGGIKLKIEEAKAKLFSNKEEKVPLDVQEKPKKPEKAEAAAEIKKTFGKAEYLEQLRNSSQRFLESEGLKGLSDKDLTEILNEIRSVEKEFESKLGKPQKNPEKNIEELPKKPSLESLVAIVTNNESLQPIIQELEDLRQLFAKRGQLLKFAIKPKGFRDFGAFKGAIEMLEANDDPLLKAGTKEGLLMDYMKIALEWSPNLFESWDPKTSNEKLVNHFKKMWSDLLIKIRQ